MRLVQLLQKRCAQFQEPQPPKAYLRNEEFSKKSIGQGVEFGGRLSQQHLSRLAEEWLVGDGGHV